jgi:pimeloyl-ACP methyl ester carboxylesterase
MNRIVRFGFRMLSAVAPRRAATIGARLWFAVPRPPLSEQARRFLATGRPFEISVGGTPVAGWQWGAGAPVLLVHGWGGYAAQLQAFVEPLVRAGFQAVAIDAPSHGMSGPSQLGPKHATLFDFSDTMLAVSREMPAVAGIIAHSGGCAAAAWALRQHPSWPVRRMVFIAPFGSPARYMEVFQRMLGLSDRAMRRFRADTERQFRFQWKDFEVVAIADAVRTPPLLVVHDKEDRETAWQDGADIAAKWPNATLQTTTGLGHNRILRDASVVSAVVAFLTAPSESRATG